MAETAGKRSAEIEPSVDTYAVCTNCSRLSTNLHICTSCGSALSEDNIAQCYSSEPKRSRQESRNSGTNHIANGDNSNSIPSSAAGAASRGGSRSGTPHLPSSASSAGPPQVAAVNSRTMNSGPAPVPQHLYVNTKNSGAPVSDPARPQALYMNVTNMPGIRLQGSGAGGSLPVSITQTGMGVQQRPLTTNNQTSGSRLVYSQPQGQSIGIPPNVSLNSATSALATNQLRSLAGNQTMVRHTPPPPYGNSNAAPTSHVSTSQGKTMIAVPTYEIRIGSKSFTPSTSVQFKEDGVLFTLNEYTNAPVLLNARAIVRCRANLYKTAFPAMFFYLEASCIKQIRSIFRLRNEEFSDTHSVEIRRCITLFPSISSKLEAETILEIFKQMESKFSRQEPIIEMIDNGGVLDLFYGTFDSQKSRNTSSAASLHGNNANQSVSLGNTRPPVSSAPHFTGQSHMPAPTGGTLQGVMRNMVQTRPPNQNANNSQPPNMQRNTGSPPTLVVPPDPHHWAQIQKNLVVGGVYQVKQQGSAQKQFCLWNGGNLVPCIVQNTEVQLQCSHVRIGSMKAHAADCVRVKSDLTKSGITFKLKTTSNDICEIFISQDDLVKCLVCFDTLTAMFVYPTGSRAQAIRDQLKMTPNKDPNYSPMGRLESQKHIILYLKDINQDQKDALIQMKRSGIQTPGHTRPMIEQVDLKSTLKILFNIRVASGRMAHSHGSVYEESRMSASKIIKELLEPEALPKDDDDDDVIMMEEEIGVKCPYTQAVMKEPVKNKLCQHNYEKSAIYEFISRKKGNAKCPYAGCGNTVPLRLEDLEDNIELKEYIRKEHLLK